MASLCVWEPLRYAEVCAELYRPRLRVSLPLEVQAASDVEGLRAIFQNNFGRPNGWQVGFTLSLPIQFWESKELRGVRAGTVLLLFGLGTIKVVHRLMCIKNDLLLGTSTLTPAFLLFG